MHKYLLTFLLLLHLASCDFFSQQPGTTPDDKALRELIGTDQAFSYDCETKGYKKAFIDYAAPDAVLLRPGELPLVDDAVIRYISAQEDTSFTLSWEVKGGDLAASGDLGYTYGVYRVKAGRQELKGTYVSIWRRQDDGSWKFVLDSGNAGTGEAN
ncbi:MAG TPA: DUF4440 domain-containing protein [Lacibacter sp.]|nr:DUF4440 domain-containing protein [Lacibacter sp.]HMO87532.1 DUF4440 domain-containing protein [Lacibacter sp.]HMP87071.1 DUF4440 domain-containing protein [Lacibacter sp.]